MLAARDPMTAGLFRFDRTLVLSIAFAFCVFSPLSIRFFKAGGGYLAEAAFALFFALVFLLRARIDPEVMRKTIKVLLIGAAVITPFFVIAIANGGTFIDAYSDYRSTMICIGLTGFLFAVDSRTAYRVIVIASLTCLAIYCWAWMTGSTQTISSALDSGKVTYPLTAFCVMIFLLAASRSVPLMLLAIVGFAVISAPSAFRQVYLLLGGSAFLACWLAIGGTTTARGRSTALFGAAATVGFGALMMKGSGAVLLLQALQHQLRIFGVNERIIYQLIGKSILTLSGAPSPGDDTYAFYFSNLLNVKLFWLPRGIGYQQSMTDPTWGGANTIDNSIIYLNYHYSIWVMLLVMCVIVFIMLRTISRLSVSGALVFLAATAPIILATYVRASPMTIVLGAVSFAFALRGLSLLVEMMTPRGRRVPATSGWSMTPGFATGSWAGRRPAAASLAARAPASVALQRDGEPT